METYTLKGKPNLGSPSGVVVRVGLCLESVLALMGFDHLWDPCDERATRA